MSKAKAGDYVEVSIRGQVSYSQGSHLVLDDGDVAVNLRDGITVRKLPRPKPKAGELITGEAVIDTAWKRGSIIRFNKLDRPLVLFGDGFWYDLSDFESYGFDSLAPAAHFEVLHVA